MSTRLSLLPHLQSWNGTSLAVRLLVAPRGSPLDPLDPGLPPFASAKLDFAVHLVAGPDAIPTRGGASTIVAVNGTARPQAVDLFKEMGKLYTIDPAPPPAKPLRAGSPIKKYLPQTYRTAAQIATPRSAFSVMDDSYDCAFTKPKTTPLVPIVPTSKVTWGKVYAMALRQPIVAEAVGLVIPLDVAVAPAKFFSDGGWLFVELAASSDLAPLQATADGVKIYATRIPPLTAARKLFTPVLFPVAAIVPPGPYDEIFAEVITYDDGFAKAAHGMQPRRLALSSDADTGARPARDGGIRIGWDDDQIVVWLNRQIDPSMATLDAPLGVHGYRVDVRAPGTATWSPLCAAKGPVTVGTIALSPFDGELAVETHPVQLDGDAVGDRWLPMYFTSWMGAALVGADPDMRRFVLGDASPPTKLVGVKPGVALQYGHEYEFRVRLVDHTGGGPGHGDEPIVTGPSPVAAVPFRRFVPPTKLRLAGAPAELDPNAVPLSLKVRRPLLRFPECVYTGAFADPIGALIADEPAAKTEGREVGLPDPDVAAVHITVQVRALELDTDATDGFQTLYTTSRPFAVAGDAALTIDLDWRDVHDASTLSAAATGPVPLPTARHVRVLLAPACRENPAPPATPYFGAPDVRFGSPVVLDLTAHAKDERGLLVTQSLPQLLRAMYLQPDPVPNANEALAAKMAGKGLQGSGDAVQRIAAELHITANGTTLHGRPSRRTVFGCSAAIRHVLGPDAATLTVSSKSDLIRRWIVAVRATVDRDWSWNGLPPKGIVLSRDGTEVARLQLPRVVNADALRTPDRTQTDIVFFDAFDAKPAPGAFPDAPTLHYTLAAEYGATGITADGALSVSVLLPITTPPADTPRLVSAGIAQSPYEHDPNYSSTVQRRRMLWLEFEQPPADPEDALFGRVLAYAPDPVLLSDMGDRPDVQEPPLAIDPELLRTIVSGQSDDEAGLSAMQQLERSPVSPVHYLLPLPPGVEPTSAELFGFFTYEFRVGHAKKWTTAQARFGSPLRVTGVQHPAPGLPCVTGRQAAGLTVSAPFAVPATGDFTPVPRTPVTELWVLLYAQAVQADDHGRRNVLLSVRPAQFFPDQHSKEPQPPVGVAHWTDAEIRDILDALCFEPSAPLSCLAVEMLPNGRHLEDPMQAELGRQRILRTSPLVPVRAIC
jgi:hypothetical protein